MNRKLIVYPLVAVFSLAASMAARADDPTPDHSATMTLGSTLTRAQVQAELFKARADGSIKAQSNTYNPLAVAHSLRSRADVRAEAVAANLSGADRAYTGEDSGSFALARTLPVRSAGRLLAQK